MTNLPKDSKYHDVVESYMQNRLPQEGTHASFQHLGGEPETDLRPLLPAYSQAVPEGPVLLMSNNEGNDSDQDSDSGLMMYGH